MHVPNRGRGLLYLLLLAGVVPALGGASGAPTPAVPPTATPELVIADFENGLPDGAVAHDAKLEVRSRADRADDRALHVDFGGDRSGAAHARGVTLPLGNLVLPADGQFSFAARLDAEGAGPVPLRWLAVDARGRTVRQAKMELKPDDAWQNVSVPLHRWRWGNDAVAAWADVRQVRIVVEGSAQRLSLDDVVVRPADGASDGSTTGVGRSATAPGESDAVQWLTRVAFQGKPARAIEADGLLVATDVAADALRDEDLRRLLANSARARTLIRRLFGRAVRPIDDATPPALLLFAGPGGYRGFWDRVGDEWSANVVPPAAGGYTVYDIATSTFDPALGADRPVYLHESVHTLVAHDLRLLTGVDRHAWLQEAVANYVQLCVHPRSLAPGSYARAFAAGPNPPGGKGLFVPLGELLGRRVTPRHYAQLASVLAFMAEREPDWLPKIAAALADGEDIDAALKRCGTDVASLEAAWLAWGRATFPSGGPERPTHFKIPPEFGAPKRD